MSSVHAIGEIDTPRVTEAPAAVPPIKSPQVWPAITVATVGYAIYIGGIALFGSVTSVLIGVMFLTLSLVFYISAVLNASAKLPSEPANASAPAIDPTLETPSTPEESMRPAQTPARVPRVPVA